MKKIDMLKNEVIHAKGVVKRVGRGHTLAEGVETLNDLVVNIEAYLNEVETTKRPTMPKWFDEWFKTFSNNSNGQDKALYYLNRTGWGYYLTDSNNKYLSIEERLEEIEKLNDYKERPEVLMNRAVLDGYNVSNEDLYYIEVLPTFVIGLKVDGNLGMFKKYEEDNEKNAELKFTEDRIKDFDNRFETSYWDFAKPVEEEED